MSRRKDRLTVIEQLITDPVADLAFKESLKLMYHAIRFEILEQRISRLDRIQQKHGTFVKNVIDIANFKHDMQDL